MEGHLQGEIFLNMIEANSSVCSCQLYKLKVMENKKTDHEMQNEEKVGVIPVSQLAGSDADSAHQEDDAAEKLAEQATKSDSDADKQTSESNTD
jgi:hypothetical protein